MGSRTYTDCSWPLTLKLRAISPLLQNFVVQASFTQTDLALQIINYFPPTNHCPSQKFLPGLNWAVLRSQFTSCQTQLVCHSSEIGGTSAAFKPEIQSWGRRCKQVSPTQPHNPQLQPTSLSWVTKAEIKIGNRVMFERRSTTGQPSMDRIRCPETGQGVRWCKINR